MQDMKLIKKKFNTLQETVTKLNNQKIGLESEIKTIESDMSDLAKKLLELTGKKTIESALEHFNALKDSLESKQELVSKELDRYLKKESSEIKLD